MSLNWVDVIKFAPGYLSFLYVLGHAGYKVRVRRNHRAIGPADELRLALEEARRILMDVVAEKRYRGWFTHENRRETGQVLKDLVHRFHDTTLKDRVSACADAWEQVEMFAPQDRGPMVRYSDSVPSSTDRERTKDENQRFRKQEAHARRGIDAANAALTRLSKLELRTRGW